jgi:membrane-bound lytic murein transglycosylase D
MIEHVLAEENVPDELKYLPLIESGLNPYAVSRAQAVGMWQFVAPTARAYGLTIDPWVDERRDPEKATRAAAHLLRDLYDMFGDWHLALAGYNCSPAVVMRAVRKAEARLGRKATFWDIYPDLPDETRGYVPMFIATALVASNPTAFGLQPPPSGPRYAFDHVPLEGVHTLREVAEMADVRLDRLRALNPELRSGRLPHSKDPYLVRLPYGSYDAFAEAYARLDAADRVRAVEHTVRPGETVGQIARRYQVTRPALLRVNPRRSAPIASDIATREERAPVRLRVPARRYRGNAALLEAAGGARPLRVQYGTRATRPLSSLPSSRQARMPATLTELAASFPTPEELAAAREATAPSSSAASKKGGTHP